MQSNGVPGSVLIVDDSAAFRRAACSMLVGEGLEARAASGARDMVDLLASWRPDVLLVDVNLAGEDGFEVGASAAVSWPEVVVVMISSRPRWVYTDRLAAAPWARGFVAKDDLCAEALRRLM